MIYSPVNRRCLNLGFAAILATALTLGNAAPQAGRSLMPVESHLVQLEVGLASVVVSTASAAVGNDVSVSSSTTAAATAAAVEDPAAIPRTIAQIALTAVGLAVSPLWYLGFPVTIPLMFLVANAAFPSSTAPCQISCEVQAFGTFFKLFTFVGGWLGFPLVVGSLANVLFPPPTGTTTTPAAARSARSAAASGTRAKSTTEAPSLRSSRSLGDSVSRRAGTRPAAASKRSVRPAAAAQSSDTSKAASATSKRRFAG